MSNAVGRRAAARLRLSYPAQLAFTHGRMHVILRNLSQTGACIELGTTASSHQPVLLKWGTYEAFGSVSWSKGKLCGLHFEEPLNEEVVAETRILDDLHRMGGEHARARQAAQQFVSGRAV